MYCHNCGRSNPKNSKFCQHCGIKFSASTKTNRASKKSSGTDTDSVGQNDLPYPYVVSMPKFITLNIATLGLYQAYWFYKQFKSFKHERGWNIRPFWRMFFAGVTSFSLFGKINEALKDIDEKKALSATALGTLYLLLSILWKLPDPYSYLSLLSFLPLIPVQQAITFYWENKLGERLVKSTFGLGNWIWTIACIIFFTFCLYAIYGLDENGNDKLFTTVTANEKVVEKVEASAEIGSWVAFTEPEKGFSHAFPMNPEHSIDNSGEFPYESYSNTIGENVYYEVSFVTYDDTIDTSNIQAFYNEMVNGIAASNADNELISSRNKKFKDMPVKEYTIVQNDVVVKGMLILKEKTLYQITVGYLESEGAPADYDKFVGSFKLL